MILCLLRGHVMILGASETSPGILGAVPLQKRGEDTPTAFRKTSLNFLGMGMNKHLFNPNRAPVTAKSTIQVQLGEQMNLLGLLIGTWRGHL